jgi:hypothetical protein
MRSAAMRFRKSPIFDPRSAHDRDALRPRLELDRVLELDRDRPLEPERPLDALRRDDPLRPLELDRPLDALVRDDLRRPLDDDRPRPREDELWRLRPDCVDRLFDDLLLPGCCGECECSVS